jgi:hypothetical protein
MNSRRLMAYPKARDHAVSIAGLGRASEQKRTSVRSFPPPAFGERRHCSFAARGVRFERACCVAAADELLPVISPARGCYLAEG